MEDSSHVHVVLEPAVSTAPYAVMYSQQGQDRRSAGFATAHAARSVMSEGDDAAVSRSGSHAGSLAESQQGDRHVCLISMSSTPFSTVQSKAVLLDSTRWLEQTKPVTNTASAFGECSCHVRDALHLTGDCDEEEEGFAMASLSVAELLRVVQQERQKTAALMGRCRQQAMRSKGWCLTESALDVLDACREAGSCRLHNRCKPLSVSKGVHDRVPQDLAACMTQKRGHVITQAQVCIVETAGQFAESYAELQRLTPEREMIAVCMVTYTHTYTCAFRYPSCRYQVPSKHARGSL